MITREYNLKDIEEIALVIRKGGLVAFPTDTVFGLAVDSLNRQAVDKLKIAKGRPEDKPFPMMVNSLKQIERVAQVNERERKIIKAFMPGALTIIFNKQEAVPDYVTNGFSTIGIRMPNDEWILELISLLDSPLLVPSANISGEPSCFNHEDVLKQLKGRIDGIVKGVSGSQLSSTIVDMSKDEIEILREGEISYKEIMEVLR